MTFNEVLALIFPSIIALLFYSKMIKRKLDLFEGICYSAFFILITNSICYAILFYLMGLPVLLFSISFTLKYSIMATCIALLIVIIYRFFELNINIKLKTESVDEKEKVNN